jgi:hypothetical protein
MTTKKAIYHYSDVIETVYKWGNKNNAIAGIEWDCSGSAVGVYWRGGL